MCFFFCMFEDRQTKILECFYLQISLCLPSFDDGVWPFFNGTDSLNACFHKVPVTRFVVLFED